MGAVDVGVERRKLVFEGIADETLGRQMIALVRLDLLEDLEDAGVALQRGGMDLDVVQDVLDAPHAMLRVLESDPAHQAVNLVAFGQKELRQVTPILAGETGDQCFRHLLPSRRKCCSVR